MAEDASRKRTSKVGLRPEKGEDNPTGREERRHLFTLPGEGGREDLIFDERFGKKGENVLKRGQELNSASLIFFSDTSAERGKKA